MAQNDFSFLPFGAGGIPANENSGTSLAAPRWYSGTAAPTSGNYYNVGDVVFNVSPTPPSGNTQMIAAWACTTAGAGGTAVFTAINSQTNAVQLPTVASTTATSGTLSAANRYLLLNPASTGTYSLPESGGLANGTAITFNSNGTCTLTPLGTDNYQYGVAAITLAAGAVATIVTDGSTHWYKAA